MNIEIYPGLAGCSQAKGVAVVIDVFRATTTLCCLLRSGPKKIFVGKSIDEVRYFAAKGEVECFSELSSPDVTHDNSPLDALTLPLSGKKALLVTRNGTVAFHAVRHCDLVLAGAFVNMDALVDFLSVINARDLSLDPIGNVRRGIETVEDSLCARTILSRLTGQPIDELAIRRALRGRILERRLDPEAPKGDRVEVDLAFSSAIGVLDVVPRVIYEGDLALVVDARKEISS
jgi:2-phosphosulfolactate phosphatase